MTKPKAIIFSGYGLNCEEETRHAFSLVGIKADIIHINDVIESSKMLKSYQIAAMPGGFSYGDDTGSGNAFAQRINNHLRDSMDDFFSRDTLTIGMCNGFQILAQMGVFGAVALLPNSNARYTTRWVDLKIKNETPWFMGMQNLSLPIAHGEGRFYAEEKTLKELQKSNRIAAIYVEGEICREQSLPKNPNGALADIAGITNKTGRILGMMPHPERAVSFTQLPHWTYLKEKYLRAGKPLPTEGPGILIFKNALSYFK